MVVEFGAAKNSANMAKHGISLARMVDMEMTEAIGTTVFRNGELREVFLAPLDGALHVAVITRRGEAIRVISLRRANSRERKRYDANR